MSQTLRILVLADTHVPVRSLDLPAQVWSAAEAADAILHAGDITDAWLLKALARFAPTYAVAGNMDVAGELGLPERRLVELAGVRIGLTHGHLGRGASTAQRALAAFAGEDVDVVVFGHSHEPWLEYVNGLLLLNPGSPTDRRRAPRASFAWLHLGDGMPEAEHVYL